MQLTATCEPAVIRLGEQASLGELVVSELVSSAVCHGGTPIWMRLSADSGDLRVEVHDGSAGRPVRSVRKHVGGVMSAAGAWNCSTG